MANPQAENGHTDIANEIMDALAKTRIPGEARQVLDLILRKTYGWHKKQDRISLSQFEEGTSLSKQHVCMAIRKLILMNLITKFGNFTEKGNEFCSTYEFNKDFHSWRPLPKKVMITEKGKKPLPNSVHTKETITKENKIGDTLPIKSRFVKPSVSEIDDYCKKRGNGIDAQRFFDRYDAVGWVYGKNNTPIKSWKSVIHIWERTVGKTSTTKSVVRKYSAEEGFA